MDVSPQKSHGFARYWPVLKWTFFAIVLAFVAQRAVQLWDSAPPESVSINGLWLILAGIVYFTGWLPSVWFWRALLQSMQQSVNWKDAIRAYYVGIMGKYVPGKALVLVIRASMMEEVGVNAVLAGVTAFCETLVFMATGAALALALSPVAFGDAFWLRFPSQLSWFRGQMTLTILIVFVATFATTPISAWLFTRISRKSMASDLSDREVPLTISAKLICQGVAVTSLGWACHALSLGLVLQSLSSQPFDFARFPMWLAAVTMSTVGGFVVLVAPGGLGVREALLIEALKDQPQVGPTSAIIAAGLLRAVWFVTELVVSGVLFFAKKRNERL